MVSLLLFLTAASPPGLQFSFTPPAGVQVGAVAGLAEGGLYAVGSFQHDAFLLRLSESGELLWTKQFGGSGDDVATAIALDKQGDILIGGSTQSEDFPTLNPLIDKPNFAGRVNSRGFVTRLASDGRILSSTYYYTTGLLSISAIRVLPSAELLLAGSIGDPGSFGTTSYRGYVSKLSSQANRVVFHTEFTGGVACQGGSACITSVPQTGIGFLDVRESDGQILVGGSTNSNRLATPDALQPNCACGFRVSVGWLGMLDTTGQPRYVTYLAGFQLISENIGRGNESLGMAAFDADGNIRAAGVTRASGFPTTPNALQRTFENCEEFCVPEADLSFYTVIDGTTGKMQASTLYGGKEASFRSAVMDPSGTMWIMTDRQPSLALLKADATGLVGSWPAPANSSAGFTPIPGGFASRTPDGQIRRYKWQDQGPRIYALSGTIAPGENVDIYTAGYDGQAWLYFDGILAAADPVPGEPGHWKVTVPEGITRNAIVDLALIADEQLSVTKVSTN